MRGVHLDINKLFLKRNYSFNLYEIDIISADDKQLLEISNKMGLSLSKDEMKINLNWASTLSKNSKPVWSGI